MTVNSTPGGDEQTWRSRYEAGETWGALLDEYEETMGDLRHELEALHEERNHFKVQAVKDENDVLESRALAAEAALRETDALNHHLVYGDMVRTTNDNWICGLTECAFHKGNPYRPVPGWGLEAVKERQALRDAVEALRSLCDELDSASNRDDLGYIKAFMLPFARATLNRPTAEVNKYPHLDALSRASRGEISAERAAIIDHNEANDYDKRD
jgi:hypothetical protein